MHSLQEVASNKPFSIEESIEWQTGSKKCRPNCPCLREYDYGVTTTIPCFIPCSDQSAIIKARKIIGKNGK